MVAGTASAIAFWYVATFTDAINLPGQGTAFVAAGVAFVVDILVSIIVSMCTQPKPDSELVGFVSSVTPKGHFEDYTEKSLPWYQQTVPLGIICLAMAVGLNIIFA